MSDVLAALAERYRLILCDLWGCVHDGYHVLPGAEERLRQWKAQGRRILFVTNAPRSSDAIRAQLDRLGLSPELYDGIVTAGEAGAAALRGREVGFCGTDTDRADLERAGLQFVEAGFSELACAGLEHGETVDDYRERLEAWARDDVLLHCFNPDRVVIHGGRRMICAGALADLYEELGGRTCWYGKPYPATYDYALQLAGWPPRETVLAIGDGPDTDMLGAARAGIDALFVSGGIHAGEPFPADFARRHGLGEWAPIAAVPSL